MRRQFLLLVFLMLFSVSGVLAQALYVQGTVVGKDDNLPIPGVSVVIKGTTMGTVTDFDGKYKIKIPSTDKVLVFSYVGMKSQEIPVAGKSTINVSLASDAINVDEVMVVAFGTAKKESFTGSAVKVSSEKIAMRQVSSVTNAIEGSASGIRVTASSGQPGEDATIRIRGIGSLNASNDPLIVLDGIPYDGKMSSINPSDIDSYTVLKDASASSLYGSRGANGVIVITTKSGKAGKTSVNFSAKYGWNSRAVPEYDIMTEAGEYYEAYWFGLRNGSILKDLEGGKAPNFKAAGEYASANLIKKGDELQTAYNAYDIPDGELVDPITGKINPNAKLLYQDNWGDELFKTGNRSEYNVSISGGNEKSKYFASFGYLNDEGYNVGSKFERYSSRFKYNRDLADWVNTAFNMSYSRSNQNFPTSKGSSYINGFSWTRNIAPIYPVYERDDEGGYVYDSQKNRKFDFGEGKGRPYGSGMNPVASQLLDKKINVRDAITMGNITKVDLFKGLTFTNTFNYNIFLRNYKSFTNPIYGSGAEYNGSLANYDYRTRSMNTSQLFQYKTDLAEGLKLDAMVGHEIYDYELERTYAYKRNLFLPDEMVFDNFISVQNATGYIKNERIEGYLSRLNLEYNDKYYLSASVRRDGSSRFSKENRWGTFWSVGGTWRISEENFLKNTSWLTSMKLRASYGTQGNQSLLDPDGYSLYYADRDTYTVGKSGDDISLTLKTKGNKELTWEVNNTFSTALEYGLFDNKINGTIEYFNRVTKDLLYNEKQPGSSGLSYIPKNIGDMKNEGIEMDVNIRLLSRKKFNWTIGLNGTYIKNTILKLPAFYAGDGIRSGNYIMKEGESYRTFYLPKSAGVDPVTGKALFYKKDSKENKIAVDNKGDFVTTDEVDGLYYENTKQSALPDFEGGINTTINFCGFDFSALLTYQLGGKMLDYSYNSLLGFRRGDNFHRDIMQSWTPENKNSTMPIFAEGYRDGTTMTTNTLISSNYFALRNITLGYTLPNHIVQKANIQNLRVFVVADNFWLKSEREGMDPRQSTGSSNNNYSPIKSFSVGLNLNF
ncbi:TonB-dependent receptor [Prolixibacteraceae bacterium]|nr:TonB-dependent receptor [Prolixibacteraceae bacterium]